MKRALWCSAVVAAARSNVDTPFPPGLEPLEDNPVALGSRMARPRRWSRRPRTRRTSKIYGQGYVLVAPGTLWAAAKSPAPNIATCSTDEQAVTENNDAAYEYSFLVHYTSTTSSRSSGTISGGSAVDGTPDAPTLGDDQAPEDAGQLDFISLSEGTIQVARDRRSRA